MRASDRGTLWITRWVLVAVLSLAGSGAWAQRPDIDPSIDTLRRQREIQEGVREGEAVPAPAPTVQYEEVLRRPNDVALNYAWAQTQVQRGDIKGAANTLERILLLAPDQAPVRLLYAIVLYRLERLDEAALELSLLRNLPMEPSLRAEIERYEFEISLARKDTRYSASVSVGLQYDWNRNSAPRSGEVSLFDFRLPVAPSGRRKSDWQLQTYGRIEMDHRLSGQGNDRLQLSANYVRGEQARLDEYDYQVGGVEVGAAIDFAPTWLVPNAYARRMRMDNQYYGRIEGVSLRAEQNLSGRFNVYGFADLENQTYDRVPSDLQAPFRSGVQTSAGIGFAWVINPEHRIAFEAGNVWKNARERFESYVGPTASLTHTWLLGGGIFLVTTLGGDINTYKEPDVLVSAMRERDRIGRLRSTFGVPVAMFINDEAIAQSQPIRDLTLYATVEAYRARSNIPQDSYDNHRFAFGITKRWDF